MLSFNINSLYSTIEYIIDIDNWKLDKLMAADYMFFNCNKLVSIKGVDKLNNNRVQCNNIFNGCKYKPSCLINK